MAALITAKTIDWVCPYCETEYTIDARYAPALKDKQRCKFCERKDPAIPTTAEMDGLLTRQDMLDRFKTMQQCTRCLKWTQQDSRKENKPCGNCGAQAFDIQSSKSLRTYDPTKDAKRKITYKKK